MLEWVETTGFASALSPLPARHVDPGLPPCALPASPTVHRRLSCIVS
jgi:hypothetical protein